MLKNHNRYKVTPEKLLLTGALVGAIALGGTEKGREIVRNAYDSDAPERVQESNIPKDDSEPKLLLKYDLEKDKGVFGFADSHLQGDPRKHLEELQTQLPKEDQEIYNVPDGFEFRIDASDLDDPADEQIVGLAPSVDEK